MVVLMDPMEDPDDILRAHRSREKSYLFDVAFDFTATQVREAWAWDSLCPTCEGALGGPAPTPSLPSTLAPWLPGSHAAGPERAGGAGLLHGHARAGSQTPPCTAPLAAGGPYGSWRKALEAHLAWGRVSGKLTPSQGPRLAHLWAVPSSRCKASSRLGANSQL